MTQQELKNWIKGSPTTDVKELKWQLFDMGQVVNESDIAAIQIDISKINNYEDALPKDADLLEEQQ